MVRSALKTWCAGLCLAAVAGLALAANDADVKAPKPPAPVVADKSARCLPVSVNECRTSCERKKPASTDKAMAVKQQNECKSDCIRGC